MPPIMRVIAGAAVVAAGAAAANLFRKGEPSASAPVAAKGLALRAEGPRVVAGAVQAGQPPTRVGAYPGNDGATSDAAEAPEYGGPTSQFPAPPLLPSRCPIHRRPDAPLGASPHAADETKGRPRRLLPGETHRRHVVADGDTLSTLAVRYLGSGERAAEIYDANRDVLASPHVLPIGAELRIPPP